MANAGGHFEAEAMQMLEHFMKARSGPGGADGSLPWGELAGHGVTGKECSEGAEEEEAEGDGEDGDEASSKRRKVSDLKKQLSQLKLEIKKAKKRTDPPAAREGVAKKKVKQALSFRGSITQGEGPSGGSSSSPSSSESEPSSEPKKKRLKKKKKSPEKKAGKKPAAGSRKKKKSSKAKKGKDKGAFGVGSSEEVPGSSSSGSDSSDFQKAPAGMTLFLRLQRYAQRHPGRLAARLLRTMAQVSRFPVGALKEKGTSALMEVQPAAVGYYNTAMVPNLRDRWTPRTQREIRYMTILLDLLAEGKAPQAADVIAQRLKALEKSVQDGNQWKRARFLELVESEEAVLMGRGEEAMIQKELEREEKLRGGVSAWEGKGHWKGRGKNEKGGGKKGEKGDRPKGKEKGKTNQGDETATKKGA